MGVPRELRNASPGPCHLSYVDLVAHSRLLNSDGRCHDLSLLA